MLFKLIIGVAVGFTCQFSQAGNEGPAGGDPVRFWQRSVEKDLSDLKQNILKFLIHGDVNMVTDREARITLSHMLDRGLILDVFNSRYESLSPIYLPENNGQRRKVAKSNKGETGGIIHWDPDFLAENHYDETMMVGQALHEHWLHLEKSDETDDSSQALGEQWASAYKRFKDAELSALAKTFLKNKVGYKEQSAVHTFVSETALMSPLQELVEGTYQLSRYRRSDSNKADVRAAWLTSKSLNTLKEVLPKIPSALVVSIPRANGMECVSFVEWRNILKVTCLGKKAESVLLVSAQWNDFKDQESSLKDLDDAVDLVSLHGASTEPFRITNTRLESQSLIAGSEGKLYVTLSDPSINRVRFVQISIKREGDQRFGAVGDVLLSPKYLGKTETGELVYGFKVSAWATQGSYKLKSLNRRPYTAEIPTGDIEFNLINHLVERPLTSSVISAEFLERKVKAGGHIVVRLKLSQALDLPKDLKSHLDQLGIKVRIEHLDAEGKSNFNTVPNEIVNYFFADEVTLDLTLKLNRFQKSGKYKLASIDIFNSSPNVQIKDLNYRYIADRYAGKIKEGSLMEFGKMLFNDITKGPSSDLLEIINNNINDFESPKFGALWVSKSAENQSREGEIIAQVWDTGGSGIDTKSIYASSSCARLTGKSYNKERKELKLRFRLNPLVAEKDCQIGDISVSDYAENEAMLMHSTETDHECDNGVAGYSPSTRIGIWGTCFSQAIPSLTYEGTGLKKQ